MAFFNTPAVAVGAAFGRSTNLLVPNDWRDDVSYPLLILLHSYGQTASDVRTRLGHAEAHNYDDGTIVLAPTGTLDGANTHWNYWDTAGPDFTYLAGCIAEARGRFNISWCGLMGYSNGGFMAIQFAIQNPTLVHTMATVACAAGVNDPTSPTGLGIPHLHFHASVDGTVNPAGDASASTLPGSLNGRGGVGSTGYTDTAGTVSKSANRNGLGAGSLGAPGTPYDIWSTGAAADETANEEWSGGTSSTRVVRALGNFVADGHGLTVSTPPRGGAIIHSWMRANHRTP